MVRRAEKMEWDMRKFLLAGAATLALAACSQQKSQEPAPQETRGSPQDMAADAVSAASEGKAESEAGAPPEIDANVAPGVAFDFSYTFALPEKRIAEAQEGHARMCAKLGISRCRVTSLNFEKQRDGEVNAMLAFRIDPALALSFGRDATELVEESDGKLETSVARGEDVGSQIVEGDKSAAQLRADLKRIEAQLAIPKLSGEVKQRLLEEQREIRQRLERLSSTRGRQVEDLATTPVVFNYEPSEAIMGFDRGSAAQTGLSAGMASFSAMLSVVAFAAGAFGPWLLLGAAAFWAWRRVGKKKMATPVE